MIFKTAKLSDSLKGISSSQLAHIGGGALIGGASSGYSAHRQKKRLEKQRNPSAKYVSPLTHGLLGAAAGGLLGHQFHHAGTMGGSRQAKVTQERIHDTIKEQFGKVPSAGAYTAGGAAIGGITGGIGAYRSAKKKEKEYTKLKPGKDPRGAAVSGAVRGALGGAILGSTLHSARTLNQYAKAVKAKGRGISHNETAPSWIGTVSTRKGAKDAYREASKMHHPDLAANETDRVARTKKFQQVSDEWKKYQNSKHFRNLPEEYTGTRALAKPMEPLKGHPTPAPPKKKGWAWKHLRGRKLRSFAHRNPEAVGAAGGAIGGAGLGAIGGALKTPDKDESRGKNALKGAAGGAVRGAATGAIGGHLYKGVRDVVRFGGAEQARHDAKLRRNNVRRDFRDVMEDILSGKGNREHQTRKGLKKFFPKATGKGKIFQEEKPKYSSAFLAFSDEILRITEVLA